MLLFRVLGCYMESLNDLRLCNGQFELVSHFVHCFGMALPKVASRVKGYPIYADQVRDKEYDCLPATGADAVRFLQLAMRHIESTMGIQIFPVGHLTRRPFLRPLGFGALVSGYLVRPLLPEILHHMQRFPSLISTTGLTFPEPCGQVRMGSQPHGKRVQFSNRFFQRMWYLKRQRDEEGSWMNSFGSTLLVWMYRMGFSIPFGMLFSLLVVGGLHMLAQILCRSRLDSQVGEIL